jgi:hypothetical protein
MNQLGTFPTLARLLAPVSVDDFLTHYWEREHLHVPVAQRSGPTSLATVADIDAAITSRPHYHPDVILTDAARTAEVDEYADDDNRIDPVRLAKRFSTGATLVINRLDESLPRVRELCASLESELGILVQANMYLTPRNAQGFPIHYDNHDVLIVQCEGRKRWRLYDTPKPLPMRGERFDSAVTKPGALSSTFVLDPGDILYVPRGLMHDAVNEDDDVSLHVTIGLHAVRWAEVLLEAVARAATEDIELRRGVPLGALTGAVQDDRLADTLRSLATRVLDGTHWQRVRARVESQYLSGHKERLGGLLLDAATAVSVSQCFVRREGARTELSLEGEAVLLSVQGRTTRWPTHAHSTLERALSRETFTLADLGDDLDEKGRVTLVRRLMAEGAVRIAR